MLRRFCTALCLMLLSNLQFIPALWWRNRSFDLIPLIIPNVSTEATDRSQVEEKASKKNRAYDK